MRVVLINPNIVSQKWDVAGSGIPYMPVMLAYLASYLRERGHHVTVIDAFGLAPERLSSRGRFLIQGLSTEEVVERVPVQCDVIGFYAHLVVTHVALERIIAAVRTRWPSIPQFVFENQHLVNAYSLRATQHLFFELGVDYLALGDIETSVERLLHGLAGGDERTNLQSIIAAPGRRDEGVDDEAGMMSKAELDTLPYPAWDLIPLDNYWKLGYSHAPITADRYLPILTSRGCPFTCTFCISPGINGVLWRKRSAESVFNEIRVFTNRFDIEEFHIEDLNPTIDRMRFERLSRLLIDADLGVEWKLAQGTKIETLRPETIQLMARAGCRFISFSPESGSPRMLKLMKKPFRHQRALELVKEMKANRIRMQACFVIGHPGEEAADLRQTRSYAKALARHGVDEIAVFIASPLPGSLLFGETLGRRPGFRHVSELTLSPAWRSDYWRQSFHRYRIALLFTLVKLMTHPREFFGILMAFISGRFQTKTEMTLYRMMKVSMLHVRGRLLPAAISRSKEGR